MADSAVAITAGAGTNIDTRTEATNGQHRQVVVLGDPSLNAGVAPVDATNGLAVQIIPALPAGANAIGKLAANSGVTIGAVEIAAAQTLGTVTTVTSVTAIGTSVTPGTSAAHLGKAEDAVHGSGDTGVMALAVRADSAAATAANGDYVPLLTDEAGRLHTKTAKAGTATVTSVNDTNVSTTLLSATAARLGMIITNTSTVACYVKYGTTASATSFTYILQPNETLEDYIYTGRVDAIWASDQSGAAVITELTA